MSLNIVPSVSDEFSRRDLEAIERRAQELGRDIFERLALRRLSPLARGWWDEQIMGWAMADPAVKVEMFRFVDVLPMLDSDDAVTEHLQEYFQRVKDRLPLAARTGLALARPGTLAGRILAKAARAGAGRQARGFIAGSTLGEVGRAVREERKRRRAFTLDILGEAVTSRAEADWYYQAYLDLIRGVAPTVNAWDEVTQIDRDEEGKLLPRTNISVKLSALDSQFDEVDPAGTTARVAPRLGELLRTAREHRTFINVDMESYHTKDLTLDIFRQVLEEDDLREMRDVGIVIQCYLKDAGRDLVELRDWARRRGTPVWVRIVKGAYWDYETVRARAAGWPVPVYEEKWQSDANFERQCRFLMRNHDALRPAIATHNIRSIAYSLAVAEHVGLAQRGFELQMLYGMGGAEKDVLVELGYRLRIYMPYGKLIPGMAYLVRRLLENTSNESFLRATFAQHVSVETLLMNPLQDKDPASLDQTDTEPDAAEPHRAPGATGSLPATTGGAVPERAYWETFANEPVLDFARREHREAMQTALEKVTGACGGFYPLVIGGEKIETDQRIESRDPSHKDRMVGTAACATADNADQAIRASSEAQPAWAALGAEKRAEYLRNAAEAMRSRRAELAAWIVCECGKPWREADADVCEAIDFCEYYAAGAVAMERPHGVRVPGEENQFMYLPRGVAAVIAPWNFPLAILSGMTTAALATGNTVVMKPAEQSPVIAAHLMEIFSEIGLPVGVLNYLPGSGAVAGAALVDHPKVALVAFTGSRDVGLAINARAAELSRTSTHSVKRVIAEMGGKNAILVDDDADLDEAVLGVVKSAFGYQGQKCSACSRAIVLDAVYEVFLGRLVEATRSLAVGPAEDPATSVGPVIDSESLAKVQRYIEIGRREGREVLSVDVGPLAAEGHFVGPHIFADVAADAEIAQEEIFGPVLAVIRAKDLDEAIQIANGTRYALTAGIFSRSPAHLERARRELLAGNLYLNRRCTGAIVGRQPFGGFKLSGIGSQAGGPDYLMQFVVPKTVTENTMRRGFAPDAE